MKNLSHSTFMFPGEVEQGGALPSHFGSYCKQRPFSVVGDVGMWGASFSRISVLLVGDLAV